ncbi:hypothetical protein C1I92_27260 [Jiangella anatolica]|uniref:HNH nuclease domain-containing protein n=1 Tax=Jiangella anatolica TaxID=2670374 RepID=A0A2W2BVN3_9ACTN|nr:hypothetical protein C1I92_27260 [Jiangella anatolica]
MPGVDPAAWDWDVLGREIEAGFAERSSGVLPADAAETPAGPELAAVVAGFDPHAATGYDLVEAAAAVERLTAWVAARRTAVLAALASRPELRPELPGCRSVSPVTNTAVEVAGRCRLTVRQAENQVGHAVQLVADFPDTHAALSAGMIDERRARVITDELGGQDPAVRARVEGAVLPVAPELDSVALRKLITRLLHELAPVETAERHRAACERRYVAVTPASDGMAFLEALLPAEAATALDTALNAAAADAKRADAAAGTPARTRAQHRADALAELGWAALAVCADAAAGPATATARPGGAPVTVDAADAGCAPEAGPRTPLRSAGAPAPRRRPVSVHVTVPFATLAGLTDRPGDLDGYGPIPAHVARALAAEGVWSWLATDPGSGQLLDAGRTRYRPSTALAEFITARDHTCRAPGCHRPARSCDLDHLVPFAAGGGTDVANLHALCETHHLLKHHGRWRPGREPDGTTRWHSPTGHQYLKPPARAG